MPSSKLIRDALWVLIPFLAIMLFFTFNPLFRGEEVMVSVEREEELGDLVMEQLFEKERGFEEIEDSLLEQSMLQIEGRLVKEVGLTDFEHDIRVVKSDRINAFALPGGNIVVCSGLIEFTKKPEELAAVIAHEIGHVEERHIMERIMREFGKGMIMTVLGNGGGGTVLSDIGSNSISATFDRQQEREADDYALRLMVKCGIPPHHMGDLFKRMKEEKYSAQNPVPELLKSHPDLNSRIKKALEYEPKAQLEPRPLELGMEWEKVRERLQKEEG